jgi:Zn-dependent protease with chaperone function
VIGHEVAHALARHSAERLSGQRATTAVLPIAPIGLAAGSRDHGLRDL